MNFAETCAALRCASCGFSLLSGDYDDKCEKCDKRLCVGCQEAVHHPGCVVGDPTDLDPFSAEREKLQTALDRLLEQVYRFNQGTETAFVLMRDARDGLARERGLCSKVGHSYSPGAMPTCHACGIDKEET